MNKVNTYENFPFWIVLVSNLFSLIIYLTGFFIMYHIGVIPAVAYLLFVLILEVRIIKDHCVNCYYWGKTCGFAKGRLSSLLFKKGVAEKFCNMEITWVSMIPDMLVSVIPLITGIVILILDFRFYLLASLIFIILFSTIGNGFVRGSLTCKHCKQKEFGCPAYSLFNKN